MRAGEWEAPLRIDAEQLVLAALGAPPLLEVETEGLPLSLVRAAEAATRAAVPGAVGPAEDAVPAPDDSLAGALFLARAAVEASGCTVPVPLPRRTCCSRPLADAGLEPEEVPAVLPHLPVEDGTIARITASLPGD